MIRKVTLPILSILFAINGCGGSRTSSAAEDKTGPEITLKGDNPLTLEVGEKYHEAGATAVDDTDSKVAVKLSINLEDELNSGLNKNRLGTYHITYTAVDQAGNQSSAVRTVYVRVTPTQAINDTGVDWGADTLATNSTNCKGMSIIEQDCSIGRDKLSRENKLKKIGSGAAGFDFTKLGHNGKALAIQNKSYSENGSEALGTKWSCVKDNATGLVWEVKRNVTRASNLHSKEDYFALYDTNSSTNGGRTGNVLGDVIGQCFGMTQQNQNDPASYCNTEAFIARVNTEKLCGSSNWRLPSKKELVSIIHYGAIGEPLIDKDFFPNAFAQTIPGSPYWASDALPVDNNFDLARLISFTTDLQSSYSAGETLYGNETNNVGYVRLVH